MKVSKFILSITLFLGGALNNAVAQKKLANDLYTYNYASIIKQNNSKAIAKKPDYPNQRILAFSYSQSESNALAFEAYSELFSKYAAQIDNWDRLCYALVARKIENYTLSDSLLWLLKSTEYLNQPFFNELSQEFIDKNKDAENYLEETDYSTLYAIKPFGTNSLLGEYALVPDKKGNAYFSTQRESGLLKTISAWQQLPYYQIYQAKYSDTFMGLAVAITNNNKKLHQHVSCVDPNNGLIYITRSAKTKNAKNERVLQIFAMRQNSLTKEWLEIPFQLNNTEYSVADLVISLDGSKVVFASDMPGGFGKSDLYEAPITKSDASGIVIGEAKNMGPDINTALRDNFPSFSDSGQFYFSSDGHLGYGGLDVFYLNANNNSVTNAGRPINSSHDDFAVQIHDRDAWGTLTSNRNVGGSNDDLFYFRWLGPPDETIASEESEKLKDGDVIVEVFDSESGLGIANAEVTIDDLNDMVIAVKGQTDAMGSHVFSGIVSNDPNLNLQVTSHPCGYRYASADSIIYLANGTRKIVLKAEAYKVGDDLGELFDINTLHYSTAKFEILEDSKKELDKLVAIMQDNQGLSVELGSHTDSKSSETINLVLSKNRALAAYKYLISRGADPSHISFMGYGESQLKNKCKDGVVCAEADHALNRRTEFVIRKILPCTTMTSSEAIASSSEENPISKEINPEAVSVKTITPVVKPVVAFTVDAAVADIAQNSKICGDADGDGIPDYLDSDSDNDGIPDATEGRNDNDKDGKPNFLDRDSDNDGISDGIENVKDNDKDGLPNYLDLDSDNDGIEDKSEGIKDSDKDGIPDCWDADSDNDGVLDKFEGPEDFDQDGIANYLDLDSDGDGINDTIEGRSDIDNDGKPNFLDIDSDGDTIIDALERGKSELPTDSDTDGKPDYLDTDSDDDGISDKLEAPACLIGQTITDPPVEPIIPVEKPKNSSENSDRNNTVPAVSTPKPARMPIPALKKLTEATTSETISPVKTKMPIPGMQNETGSPSIKNNMSSQAEISRSQTTTSGTTAKSPVSQMPTNNSNGPIEYRVQFQVSTKSNIGTSFIGEGVGPVLEYEQDGYFKYCTDKVFSSVGDAIAEKTRLRSLGFPSAFVVGFQNGARVK